MIRIDLASGRIHDWPEGTTADVHYKVCDAGQYWLADEAIHKVAQWDGYYVPGHLRVGGDGYGDYIILKVDGAGMIEGWTKPTIDPDAWKFSSHNRSNAGMRTRPTTSDSIESGVDLQRLVLLLGNVEKHLLSVYGKTVADFESDPAEEEGWILYCEVKAERDRILKQNVLSIGAPEKSPTKSQNKTALPTPSCSVGFGAE